MNVTFRGRAEAPAPCPARARSGQAMARAKQHAAATAPRGETSRRLRTQHSFGLVGDRIRREYRAVCRIAIARTAIRRSIRRPWPSVRRRDVLHPVEVRRPVPERADAPPGPQRQARLTNPRPLRRRMITVGKLLPLDLDQQRRETFLVRRDGRPHGGKHGPDCCASAHRLTLPARGLGVGLRSTAAELRLDSMGTPEIDKRFCGSVGRTSHPGGLDVGCAGARRRVRNAQALRASGPGALPAAFRARRAAYSPTPGSTRTTASRNSRPRSRASAMRRSMTRLSISGTTRRVKTVATLSPPTTTPPRPR